MDGATLATVAVKVVAYLASLTAAGCALALAGLAWATDVPETPRSVGARRYDFGPDPYARYRSP